MKLKELLKVIPGITSATIHIKGKPGDRRYLFVDRIENDLYDYEVLEVSIDYCKKYCLFIELEVSDEEH